MPNLSARRQFIDAKTGQLHLRVAGHRFLEDASDGETALLCLHMMPKSSRSFVKLMPELAKDRLVIAPDYPGYGESDGLGDESKPSIEDYADSVYEVIEQFCLSKVDIVGYHTGSMVAVNLAKRYPEIVGKVVNLSAPILTEQEVADFNDFFAPIPLDREGNRFRIMWERVVQFSGPDMTLEMAAVSMAENLRGGERYEDGHAAAFAYAKQYAEDLGLIQQPLFVMNLGDDLFEYTQRVDNYLNNGRRQDYPEWGHGCLELWPDLIANEIRDFLDE